jgi:predicted aminopeptidase
VPAFEAALAAAGGDLPAFYAAMAALDPGQRQAFMASAMEPVGAELCAAPL